MLVRYTKNPSVAEVHQEGESTGDDDGRESFAGHAKDFELNPRYHEWSLIQFNFLKEHFGE